MRALLLTLAVLSVIFYAATESAHSAQTSPDSNAQASGTGSEKPQRAGLNGVSMPSCSYMPNPSYTKEARHAKLEGNVLIEAVIKLDGTLTNMRVIKALGSGLDESALTTLHKWKCKPATGAAGKPVPTLVTFQINFRLSSN
jgi:TonB family protein